MIRKILIKNNLSFSQALIEPGPGLSVFTGLSGAGKSVLFRAILSALGLAEAEAGFVEIELDDELGLAELGILGEELNVFKLLREKNAKYFINNQAIAKRSLASLASGFVKYLGARETNELSNEKLLALLDALAAEAEAEFAGLAVEFAEGFEAYVELSRERDGLAQDERRVEELKELAQFQIERIERLAPRPGEYEELLAYKKRLSKKDKIDEAWARAGAIFELEAAVAEALRVSEAAGDFASEFFNELRVAAETARVEEEGDIEAILDRIEALAGLIKRYGSEEEALAELGRLREELERYENLSFERAELDSELAKLQIKLDEQAARLTQARRSQLGRLENELNAYLAKLYLGGLRLELAPTLRSKLGDDELRLSLDSTTLKKLSSGELNRLRLAFVATQSKILGRGRGIIFLDEVDANLSGKEAMSVGLVLAELARSYQIFAISHLPQLSSRADHHFLIEKTGGASRVRRLGEDERVGELARMVSGEEISAQALDFARTLMDDEAR